MPTLARAMDVVRSMLLSQSSSKGLAIARTECQKGEDASLRSGSANLYKNEPKYMQIIVSPSKAITRAAGFHMRNSPAQKAMRSVMDTGLAIAATDSPAGRARIAVETAGREVAIWAEIGTGAGTDGAAAAAAGTGRRSAMAAVARTAILRRGVPHPELAIISCDGRLTGTVTLEHGRMRRAK